MKKLKLSPVFHQKLDKLPKKVGQLSFDGAELESYENFKLVAIVGTRKPTSYGIKITKEIAEGLARKGIVVVSGLAFGVDSIAHQACIDAGGRTIAVLPSGLSNIYPASHQKLAKNIIKSGGTLISEYPEQHMPRKVEFLERNRIIAALSDCVVIPEAAENSGSLNTAMHALKMGIPIYAVPGSIVSPMSIGTNYLLKDTAKAVTNAQDILKNLGIKTTKKSMQLSLIGESEAETLILQKISKGVNEAAELQDAAELSTNEFQTALTMLEIQGRITQDQTGNWNLS